LGINNLDFWVLAKDSYVNAGGM